MKHTGLLFLVSFLAGGGLHAGEALPAAEAAGAVLAVSGVKAGLCLHIGCGRPDSAGLTAALAEAGGMPVHGLALDEGALTRAREAILRRGMAGRAMAEKLTEKSLPYLPGLARLVVVEDRAALLAAGITVEELLRVVAPGGVVCDPEGGRWRATVKPRPRELDDWTHPHHGPDGNLVSSDPGMAFPTGLRWVDGVPFGRGGFGDCASCRAVVLAGGRCFTVNNDDLGSGGRALLRARDAFSGFPLWTMDCQGTYGKVELDWRNTWPLAATDRRVYCGRTNDVAILDAGSGRLLTNCPTRFRPWRLLVSDGLLLTASWEKRELSNPKDGFENDGIRAVWWPSGAGSVEAFDAETGDLKWALPLAALTLAASDGTLYILTHQGNPPTGRDVVAVELAGGREKWRVPHTTFGNEADTCLNFAGPGCAVVSRSRAKGPRAAYVLSASDGHVAVTLSNTVARAIVGDELWCSDGRRDLKTGARKPGPGLGATYAGVNQVGGCVPPVVVGRNMVTSSRGGGFVKYGDDPTRPPTKFSYPGVRGACIQGLVPANGLFYTAQNNCGCLPTQVGGFLCIGPSEESPTADEFARVRPVEKGPAFGAVGPEASGDDWPAHRQNAERSGGMTNRLAASLKPLWKVPCVKPGEGQFAEAWNARIGTAQPLTAPIIAAGKLILAGLDSGEVICLDPASGAKRWTTLLGSRIDSAPTYYNGLCLVGCHDGWVYALRADDGALAYRTRIAPRERRMMAHGLVESSWPATGAVLVHGGIAYATAGRSSSTDGGMALVAFKPETGETVWTKSMGHQTGLLIDILSVRNGELAWRWMRLDPKTGAELPAAQKYHGNVGMLDGSWTAGYGKRSGGGFALGRICQSMLAWNSQLVVGAGWAVARAKVEAPKPEAKAGPKHPEGFKAEDYTWRAQLEPHIEWARVHAMALSGDSALFAGDVINGWNKGRYDGSFIWVKSTTDGKTRQKEIKLDARPCYDAMAVAGGRVYLSLQNGELLCLGEAD